MLIRWVCPGQRAFVPTRVYGQGCGGAEAALHFITKELALRGHEVKVYINTGGRDGFYNSVEYLDYNTFAEHQTTQADITVVFRNEYMETINTKRTVFFSCDQYTHGRDDIWKQFVEDKEPVTIMCISNYHRDYFLRRYGFHPDRVKVVHLGTNLSDYAQPMPKKRFQFIWCSQIDRGLGHLMNIWPKIRLHIPDATMIVTASRVLWGDVDNKAQYQHVGTAPGVTYVGAVPRAQLVRYQLESEIFPFTGNYGENFGIAACEAMAAGCVPIVTGNFGGVNEVVGDAGVRVDLKYSSSENNTFKIVADKLDDVNWGEYYEQFLWQVRKLSADHTDLVRRAEMCRARVHGNFGYSHVVDRFMQALGM